MRTERKCKCGSEILFGEIAKVSANPGTNWSSQISFEPQRVQVFCRQEYSCALSFTGREAPRSGASSREYLRNVIVIVFNHLHNCHS